MNTHEMLIFATELLLDFMALPYQESEKISLRFKTRALLGDIQSHLEESQHGYLSPIVQQTFQNNKERIGKKYKMEFGGYCLQCLYLREPDKNCTHQSHNFSRKMNLWETLIRLEHEVFVYESNLADDKKAELFCEDIKILIAYSKQQLQITKIENDKKPYCSICYDSGCKNCNNIKKAYKNQKGE